MKDTSLKRTMQFEIIRWFKWEITVTDKTEISYSHIKVGNTDQETEKNFKNFKITSFLGSKLNTLRLSVSRKRLISILELISSFYFLR